MTRRLLLDCDGTLVDSRRRQHQLFVDLAPGATIGFDEYWQHKRAGMLQAEMLQRYTRINDAAAIAAFKAGWMAAIEAPQRLDDDVLIDGVADFLTRARAEFELVLVTGRQHFEHLMNQLERLGIAALFGRVLNTRQSTSKVALVQSHFACTADDVFIGDTGEDIVTGKALGLYTVGVTSGASSAATLQRYAPDLVADSVATLELARLGCR